MVFSEVATFQFEHSLPERNHNKPPRIYNEGSAPYHAFLEEIMNKIATSRKEKKKQT